MQKSVEIYKDQYIQIHQCKDGYWLYDFEQGMNLAMRSETEHAAISEGFEYYQERTKNLIAENKLLKAKIESFVRQFVDEDTDVDFDSE